MATNHPSTFTCPYCDHMVPFGEMCETIRLMPRIAMLRSVTISIRACSDCIGPETQKMDNLICELNQPMEENNVNL